MDETSIAWLKGRMDGLATHASGCAYVKFSTEAAVSEGAAFGQNHPRLVDVKTKWDLDNLFRLNQNIRPEV